MGAANALAAYMRYAGKVPPLSMQLLTYMALVSRDHDDEPWFGLGHAALAVHALGRPEPDDSDLRAVRRAITPLLRAEEDRPPAITVIRAAAARMTGLVTVKYRLHLYPAIGRNPSCGQVVELAERRTETVLGKTARTAPT